MSSKKKASSPDAAKMIVDALSALVAMCVRYLGRFGRHLFENTVWIFGRAPGAHNDFDSYCVTHFGSAPSVWTKVLMILLLLPLVIAILFIWSALQGLVPD